MNWFRAILAAVGLVYWLLECAVCGFKVLARKGVIPPGWYTKGDKHVCPQCDPDRCPA